MTYLVIYVWTLFSVITVISRNPLTSITTIRRENALTKSFNTRQNRICKIFFDKSELFGLGTCREERISAIAEAKEEIERRAAERYAKEKAMHDQKIAEQKAKEGKTGKRLGGLVVKPPEPCPIQSNQMNLTAE